MDELINIAIEASVKAGIEIVKIYDQDFDVEYKKDNSPLTIADKNANNIIVFFLEKTGIPIISEENTQLDFSERKKWKKCWIVDPLDGTKEFVNKNGEFTVNIALIKDGKPILGVIYVPVTKELYVGNVVKHKSYKVTIAANFDINSICVNKNLINHGNKSRNIKVVGSRSHMNQATENFLNKLKKENNTVEIVSKGSSLKFCLVAEGKADVYPRFAPTMEWDTAAGQAICEAVGLQVISNETNKPLLYNKENLLNPYFIVKQ
ncbi:MAG TPA: 3'(2'),5'-bisphosphate nucleotidase [Bacteroidia bacterium]|nr:3'(2'),5'-bisphosphate nucleotidase [Bacteroidia bacterium]